MKLSDATRGFWEVYEQTVTMFFAPIRRAQGFSSRDVSAGELRLGFALPLLLREVYQRVGKRSDVTRKYHRLLGPEELRVSAGTLLFFEESQQVVFWGIKLTDAGQADPPVWQATNKKRLVWHPDHDRLSDFLLTMLYRQFLEYGANNGMVPIGKKTLSAIRRGWPRVRLRGKNLGEMEVFARDGQALCVFRQDQELELLAAGRAEQDLLAIGRRLGIVEELCGVDAEEDEDS
jgi:hypothetical protein